MADPTKSELWTQYANAVKIIDEFHKWTKTNALNYDTLENLLIQSMEGVHTANVTATLQQLRNGQNDVIASGVSLLLPILQELGRVGYNSVAGDINTIISDIRQGMDGLNETIKERGWTYGAVAARIVTGKPH